MNKSTYSKNEFTQALLKVGVQRGDIIFGHSNVGFFGLPEEGRSREKIFEVIYEAIFDVIGDEGTLVVPTFTYSFGEGEVFDQDHSPGIGGSFAESVRKLPKAIRTLDPSTSVAAIGGHALDLCLDVPENSYAENSFFDRFIKAQGKICNFNFDAASTLVHFAERLCQVPYRFDKTFHGKVRYAGQEESRTSTIYVRKDLDAGTQPAFERFNQIAMTTGKCQSATVGRGFIKCMSIQDQIELVKNTLPSEPWFLTQKGKLKN